MAQRRTNTQFLIDMLALLPIMLLLGIIIAQLDTIITTMNAPQSISIGLPNANVT